MRPTFQPIVNKIDDMLQPKISSKEVLDYLALLQEKNDCEEYRNIKRFIEFLIGRDWK